MAKKKVAALDGATMTAEGLLYKGFIVEPIVEKCDGCDRAVEFENAKYCPSYAQPSRKMVECGFVTLQRTSAQRYQRTAPSRSTPSRLPNAPLGDASPKATSHAVFSAWLWEFCPSDHVPRFVTSAISASQRICLRFPFSITPEHVSCSGVYSVVLLQGNCHARCHSSVHTGTTGNHCRPATRTGQPQRGRTGELWPRRIGKGGIPLFLSGEAEYLRHTTHERTRPPSSLGRTPQSGSRYSRKKTRA